MAVRHPLRVLFFVCLVLASAAAAMAQSDNVNLIVNVDQYGTYNDIWGYSAPDGTELAIIGVSNGTSFVDVTNPASPQEVLWVPGGGSIWRDIKTFGTFAYIVDDQGGDGLVVVDMSDPLNPFEVRRRTNEFFTSHNIFIDMDLGYAFCCGGGFDSPRTWIYDLNVDPSDPQPIYNFDDFYVHDLMTQDGVAYLSAIYAGVLATADITALPSAMPVLGVIPTDDNFTHNVWVTEDGSYAATTDEVSGGHLTIIDVSDPSSMFKVGEYNHPTDTDAIVHNVCIEDGLAHVSWYRNGYEVVDISVPSSPERAGYYDTFPGGGSGFDGAWGVYPYADNGYIYIADINSGLYVFEFVPDYGSLEGIVTDATSGNPVVGATVSIDGETRTTNNDGVYKFNLDPGAYLVEIEAYGYATGSFNTSLTAGTTTNGDFALTRLPNAPLSGNVSSLTPAPLAGAEVEILGTPLVATTDSNGDYAFDFVPAGSYDVRVGLFGFGAAEGQVVITANQPATRNFTLNASFFVDEAEANNGWSFGGTGDTGEWTRDDPNGSGGGVIQPEDDHTPDPGTECYFTGQAAPGDGIGTNDIDGGTQILFTPVFDLTEVEDPTIRYHRWYVNDGNSAVDDEFVIDISSDGGSNWTNVEILSTSRAFWEKAEFKVADFVTVTDQIQVRFTAADEGDGSIVEAAIDDFEIFGVTETTDAPTEGLPKLTQLLSATPNPISSEMGGVLRFQLAQSERVELTLVDVQGRRVATVVDGELDAGAHSIAWDGRSDLGTRVPGGIYFQVLRTEDRVLSEKTLVLQ